MLACIVGSLERHVLVGGDQLRSSFIDRLVRGHFALKATPVDPPPVDAYWHQMA